MRAMSSGSYWAYREAGALCMEQDDPDPPTKRRHCTCGAFLPQTPAGTVTCHEPVEEEWVDDADFGPYPVVTRWHEWEEPRYTCKRCGTFYSESEMWED